MGKRLGLGLILKWGPCCYALFGSSRGSWGSPPATSEGSSGVGDGEVSWMGTGLRGGESSSDCILSLALFEGFTTKPSVTFLLFPVLEVVVSISSGVPSGTCHNEYR